MGGTVEIAKPDSRGDKPKNRTPKTKTWREQAIAVPYSKLMHPRLPYMYLQGYGMSVFYMLRMCI